MNSHDFLYYYQKSFRLMWDTYYSLPSLFPCSGGYKNFTKEWSQNSLDVIYRLLECSLAINHDELVEQNRTILYQLATFNPSTIDGYAVWETYQFCLTKAGIILAKEYNLFNKPRELSLSFKTRLSSIFEEHGVGFDKKAFVPIQY
ncbi:hypothetical protein GT348_08375 [Aristophania vespae]|uniref:Uncharacterized protein n=1 Tax=Aristophania vespae TaxID=2697033 RepID=A0A6P1ND42_9PROT|nr:hypothetical protein [Aristophania vespae]QHI96236.1 hypothetical protein GT348_08375 [Aristophania vespae]